MVAIEQNRDKNDLIRLTGGFIAAFSLVMGLLVLFVIPGGCSLLGGIELLILAFMFLIGIIILFIGQLKRRQKSSF